MPTTTFALMLRSIAARSECGCVYDSAPLRCVSKHEGPLTQVGCSRLGHSILPISGKPEIGAVLNPSRRAHALSTLRKRSRMRAPQDEDGRARGSSPNRFRSFRSHDVKQPISFPRRILAPGVCDFASLTPERGVGGAPRNVRVLR